MGLNSPYFKVCIVGNFGVGKSTLLHQFLEKRFLSNVQSTIGSNFFVKSVKIPETNSFISLQIWDLAGQDHFKWVRKAFYIGAKGIIYVFDLTQKETFDDIINWKEEVENTSGFIPNVLVGNKSDLIENKIISPEESNSLRQTIGACSFEETSAKLGTGVDNIFIQLTTEMYKRYKM
ncbi:MAG: Rab family GTPase [Promethearchaeota archaeon]|jgi:Ras-related protein Rab-1A